MVGVVATVLLAAGFAAAQSRETTIAVSVDPGGRTSNDRYDLGSWAPAISADGRTVAFSSYAGGLVPGDTNREMDAFVRNLRTASTQRVSVSSGERQAVGCCNGDAVISASGRYVAFTSGATNLVSGDTNRDRTCAFEDCTSEPATDVFVRDVLRGTTRRVSVSSREAQANEASSAPVISATGRFVAFSSAASNLVGADRNRRTDVFLRDRRRGTTRLVSAEAAGRPANDDSRSLGISADGRHVLFESTATDLVPGDTNRSTDLFVRDLRKGTTERVNVSSEGRQASEPRSEDVGAMEGAISGDGRYVVFSSIASDLVAGDTNRPPNADDVREQGIDVFLHDRRRHTTVRVSVSATGEQASGDSFEPVISADGRHIAFASEAQNLVPGRDRNGFLMDVFVRATSDASTIRRVSLAPSGAQANSYSTEPALSANGRWIAFRSSASNLTARDRNEAPDIFVRGPLR